MYFMSYIFYCLYYALVKFKNQFLKSYNFEIQLSIVCCNSTFKLKKILLDIKSYNYNELIIPYNISYSFYNFNNESNC